MPANQAVGETAPPVVSAPSAEVERTDEVSPPPQRGGRSPRKVRSSEDEVPSSSGAAVELSLEALVESLLFVAPAPVAVTQIAAALEVTPREVEAALATLAEAYAQGRRGLAVQRLRDRVQLTTAPAAAACIERFLGLAATAPLSRAALETLAIIAYQQPVTRPQIDVVRGVNSDSVIKNLLSKGLIEEAGRSEGPGRPVLYVTTAEFLQHFGLTSLSDLPPLNIEASATETVSDGSLPAGDNRPVSTDDFLKG